jgi:peptidyl-prolyl cis-trans isomerase C
MSDLKYLAVVVGLGAALACNKPKPQEKDTKLAEVAATDKDKPAAELKYGLTPEQASQVLVEVGTTKITLGEFADRLGSQSPYLRARYHSPERRREFLDNMVRFELLASEAEKRGFTHSEEVERVRRQVMVQQMMEDLFDKGGLKLADITEDEIKHYYEQNQSEFDKPAQVRASHILFKDKAAAEAALKELKAKPEDNELFRKLATKSLDVGSKDNSGDLRFFSETLDKAGETDEPVRPPEVRKAAFTLTKTGELYPEVVHSEQGFHIVKLTGRRDAQRRTLEDARRMIQNKLWRQKREEAIEKFVAELRAKANVQINADALAKVKVKDAASASDKPAKPSAKPNSP